MHWGTGKECRCSGASRQLGGDGAPAGCGALGPLGAGRDLLGLGRDEHLMPFWPLRNIVPASPQYTPDALNSPLQALVAT